MKSRQPVVTVLGHVDHGKTTLLDAIRQTSVAQREAGGITQSIGASVVSADGKKITFIDTPGHAIFSQMRSRGAKVADIAVLVVAADDGIKPQTSEAISHIREAKIPFVVAITKTDLPAANPESVLGQLEKEQIFFEGRGGDTPYILVSAKAGKGIAELLEIINLVAEVNEIKADEAAELEAVVIETGKGKGGPTVSVIVRNGVLEKGMMLSCEEIVAKVKAIFEDKGKQVSRVLPGEPALILGFSDLPPVGAVVRPDHGRSLQDLKKKEYKRGKIKKGEVPLVIKTASTGVLEAISASLPKGIVTILSGVGEVTESDVFAAKSANADYIFAFKTKTSSGVSRLAETEGIKIKNFDVVYKLLQDAEELISKEEEIVLGRAKILASFPFNNRKVAGGKIIDGKFTKADKFVLMRQDKEIGRAKAASFQKGKEEAFEAKEGEEFGIILAPQLDFKEGDMILSVK